MKSYISIAFMSACLLLILSSCTKTEQEFEKRPYKAIESFKLVGYTGDSITAVINDGNIIIYWASGTTLPANITPKIIISDKATISPASGTTVAFNTETIYTVTAEDGTTQTYKLKPVINTPVPKISSINPTNIHWISSTWLTVTGEYFLMGDTADVHVYAQRLRDGFEFDLPIDKSQLTMTNITANLPEYSNIMDTGAHKIYVKIGDRISDELLVTLRKPDISYSNLLHLAFAEAGQTMAAGDSVTLKLWDDHNGNVISWYANKFTKLSVGTWTFDASQLTQTDSTIKFKIPDTPLSSQPNSLVLYFIDPYYNPGYLSPILGTGAYPIMPVDK